MKTAVKTLTDISEEHLPLPAGWNFRAVVNDDNMTYVIWNETTSEGIIVDSMDEDWEELVKLTSPLKNIRWLVMDTHTHADHISIAWKLAAHLKAPFIMHEFSPSRRIQMRVSQDTDLPLVAAPLKFFMTPGHTKDSFCIQWGPFILTGDTLLYGDVGRDDLPGGDPAAHYESVQKLKKHVPKEAIFLTGHDGKGGRACTWETQCKINPGLTQDRDTFIAENGSYVGPAPRLLKESLFENFK